MAVFASTAPFALACFLLLAFPAPGAARLGGSNATAPAAAARETAGEPNVTASSLLLPGGLGRKVEHWKNTSLVSFAAAEGEASAFGFEYLATTTRYADTCCSSCGKMDTARLVAGTDYYVVASAQAMQNQFAAGGCCWCGQAGSGCGHASGTAPMGCSACAKGRFLRKRPYDAPLWGGNQAIFEREINIVVADICPHTGNEAWCPATEGSTNQFGSKNHFDFASPPAGFDNYYLAFTPTACSGEMQQRLARMSQCGR